MANIDNLRRLTTNEAREIGKKGGQASGRKRRERKMIREELTELLRSGNTQRDMCLALLEKALQGDTRAFQVVRDTVDGKPVDTFKIGSEKDNEVHFTFSVIGPDGKPEPVPDEWMS